jgi:hypothetical protein
MLLRRWRKLDMVDKGSIMGLMGYFAIVVAVIMMSKMG